MIVECLRKEDEIVLPKSHAFDRKDVDLTRRELPLQIFFVERTDLTQVKLLRPLVKEFRESSTTATDIEDAFVARSKELRKKVQDDVFFS